MNPAALEKFAEDNGLGSNDPTPLADVEFIAMLNSRMAHPDNEVPEDVPVYSLAKTPICYKANITLIESNMKTGKTAFVSAMMAACYSQPGADTLGWESNNLAGHAVVHVDTEQSRADLHTVIKRVHKRAGADIFPSWLQSCRLRGMSISDLKRAVETLLKTASTKFGGVHSLIIDGSGDFVTTVNSPEESQAIVAWLEKLAEEYDMPVITILHLNPVTQKGQGTKARGHLGTHLYMKAEHVLRLDKDKDEITTVSTAFARKAPLPKDSQPCFKYCVEKGRHVSTAKANTLPVEKDVALRDLAKSVFNDTGGVPLRYTDIREKVASIRDIKAKSAEPLVKALIHKGFIRKAGEGYVLS